MQASKSTGMRRLLTAWSILGSFFIFTSCIESHTPQSDKIHLSPGEEQLFTITTSGTGTIQWYVDDLAMADEADEAYTYKATDPGRHVVKAVNRVIDYEFKQEWTVIVTEGCPDPDDCPLPASSFESDLAFISAYPRIGPSEHHTAVQMLCSSRLTSLGYTVALQDYGDGVNIIGTLPGRALSDEVVIVSAHYDGNGADDNASGVAGALETARLLSRGAYERTLVIGVWDDEEIGLVGSGAYVDQNYDTNFTISYVYEMIGYKSDLPGSQIVPEVFEYVYPDQYLEVAGNQFTGDFIAVIYDPAAESFALNIEKAAEANNLPDLLFNFSYRNDPYGLGSLFNRSDHYSFQTHNFPAIMITDTAELRNPNYHSSTDTFDTIDIEFALKVVKAVTASARNALRPTGQ